MAYCTTTAMQTLLPAATSFNTALASKCITFSEQMINTKLGKRYDISTWATVTPPIIIELCECIATAKYEQRIGRGSKDTSARTERDLEHCKEILDQLAANKLQIHDTAGSVIASANHPGVKTNTDDYYPTFAEDNPLNWDIDEDKLEDIGDDRD